MSTKTRRLIASRILLAVFLPMLVLSSMHIHPSQQLHDANECTECLNHHCGGHIVQLNSTMHHCVLCQFLTLTMVAATLVAVTFYNYLHPSCYTFGRHQIFSHDWGTISKRGPPAVFR